LFYTGKTTTGRSPGDQKPWGLSGVRRKKKITLSGEGEERGNLFLDSDYLARLTRRELATREIIHPFVQGDVKVFRAEAHSG